MQQDLLKKTFIQQYWTSPSHLTWPGSPNPGKFAISQPQELSQLKVKVQEQQDEP